MGCSRTNVLISEKTSRKSLILGFLSLLFPFLEVSLTKDKRFIVEFMAFQCEC